MVTRRAFKLFLAVPDRAYPDLDIPGPLRSLLLAHWGGDFGTVGRIDDESPAGSPTGMLAPRLRRNVEAIGTGRGEVVSRYDGDGGMLAVWTVFGKPDVDVITLVSLAEEGIAPTT